MDSNGSSEFLLVPHERLGALIGKKGATKKEIERKTHTRLEIDSEEAQVEVIQRGNVLDYLKALKIVKAIARGFSPEKAFRLLSEDCVFELIELREVLGKSQSALKSKKGRVIGSHGKAREEIELETGANISVYGKTIAIIGRVEQAEKAKKAVEMLLGGATHSTVYGALKKKESNERFEL